MTNTTWLTDVLDIYANMVYDGRRLSKDQKEQIKEIRIVLYEQGDKEEWLLLCNELLNN